MLISLKILLTSFADTGSYGRTSSGGAGPSRELVPARMQSQFQSIRNEPESLRNGPTYGDSIPGKYCIRYNSISVYASFDYPMFNNELSSPVFERFC